MEGFLLLVGFPIVGIVAVVASWKGEVLGPLLLALGFGVLGAFVLLNSRGGIDQVAGVLLVAACLAEFGATAAYLRAGGTPQGPSEGWRMGATLVGAVGVVGFWLLVVYALIVFMAWIGSLS